MASQAGDGHSLGFSLVTATIFQRTFFSSVFWLRCSYLCLDDHLSNIILATCSDLSKTRN